MPPIQQGITSMLDALRAFLPSAMPSLPAPGISLVKIEEKPVGIGNHIGEEARQGFWVAALRGGRLSATVRAQLWASDLSAIDSEIDDLHGRILEAKPDLKVAGFLRLAAVETSVAEFVEPLNAWRKTSDYNVLYEFRYQDTGGAESLITRIPITIDSEYNENTVVTDHIIRWDETTAPTLSLRGRFNLAQFSALVFVPATPPTGNVRLLRTFDGASGAPTAYGTLAQFLEAVAQDEPSDRHAEFTFPSFSDFLAAFSTAGGAVDLGDWDEDLATDAYESLRWILTPPIQLMTGADRFEVHYADAVLDQVTVFYLRALSSSG